MMKSKHLIHFSFLIALLAPVLAYAQATGAPGRDAPLARETWTQGEVRKLDKAAGKVTIRHGAIKSLDMEAMTMVFRARDPALLERLGEGDKIRFTAEKIGGVLTLTRVEPAS